MAYITVNKPLVARYGSLTVLAGTFLAGSLMALPLAFLSMGSLPPLASVSRNAWLGLVHLAIIVTVFGLSCQNQALKRLEASQVATVGNAAPLLTILWGVWLLGELITPTLIVGGLLVLAGILWAGRPGRSERRGRQGLRAAGNSGYPFGASRPARTSVLCRPGRFLQYRRTLHAHTRHAGRLRDQPRLRPLEPRSGGGEPAADRDPGHDP